jgi:hypothetical protein
MTDILGRAAHAEQLLNDPLLQEAFASVRTAILERIESAPMADTEGAEKMRVMLKLLRDLKANFEHAVRDGQLAKFKLEEERKARALDIQFPWRRKRA